MVVVAAQMMAATARMAVVATVWTMAAMAAMGGRDGSVGMASPTRSRRDGEEAPSGAGVHVSEEVRWRLPRVVSLEVGFW